VWVNAGSGGVALIESGHRATPGHTEGRDLSSRTTKENEDKSGIVMAPWSRRSHTFPAQVWCGPQLERTNERPLGLEPKGSLEARGEVQ
jgi:hypothetical protein